MLLLFLFLRCKLNQNFKFTQIKTGKSFQNTRYLTFIYNTLFVYYKVRNNIPFIFFNKPKYKTSNK